MLEKRIFKSNEECLAWAMEAGGTCRTGTFSSVFSNEKTTRKIFDGREVGYLSFLKMITSPNFKKLPVAVRNRFPKVYKVVYFTTPSGRIIKAVGVEMETLQPIGYSEYHEKFGHVESMVRGYNRADLSKVPEADKSAIKVLRGFVDKFNSSNKHRFINYDLHSENIMVRKAGSKVPVITDPVVISDWGNFGNTMFS